jgi:transposase-like protein
MVLYLRCPSCNYDWTTETPHPYQQPRRLWPTE